MFTSSSSAASSEAPEASTVTLPSIIAHRGNSADYAENTRAAFHSALDHELNGDDTADGIEADIHLTKDGVPVVIHDPTLLRTTGHEGSVNMFTYDELARLNYSDWRNVPIPAAYGQAGDQFLTVVALIDLLVHTTADNTAVTGPAKPKKLLIELKHPYASPSPYGRDLEDNVLSVLRAYDYDPKTSTISKHGAVIEVFFISFDCIALTHLIAQHHICPAHVSVLFEAPGEAGNTDSAHYFLNAHTQTIIGASKNYLLSQTRQVKEWVGNGRMFSTWTVNSIHEARRLHELGVTNITTNHPLTFKQAFAEAAPTTQKRSLSVL